MKKLFRILVFFGFIFILGTAGASDKGSIDGTQVLLQISMSACLIGIGTIGLKIKEKEKRPRYSQYQKRTEKNIYKKIITSNRRIVNGKF